MASKRLTARIHGRVQGVGFRFFVQRIANELGVVGYVRNTPDDAVEVVAEGEESLLDGLLDLLNEGPRAAHVSRVEASWKPATGLFERFSVTG